MNNKTEFEKGYEEGANDTAEFLGDLLAEGLANLQKSGVLTGVQSLLIALEIHGIESYYRGKKDGEV